MAREKSTPEQLARRARAFEMYCSLDAKGHRPSLRAIAHELGVTVAAVKYWMTRDAWAERISALNDTIARGATETQQSLKALLRTGALDAVKELHAIVTGKSTKVDDRIKASVALFKLAKDNNAIELESLPEPEAPLGFTDELPKKDPASHGPSEPEVPDEPEPGLGEAVSEPCSELTTLTLAPSPTSSDSLATLPEPEAA